MQNQLQYATYTVNAAEVNYDVDYFAVVETGILNDATLHNIDRMKRAADILNSSR